MSISQRMPDRPDWEWLRMRHGGANLLRFDADLLDVARVMQGRVGYLATPFSGVVAAGGRFSRARAEAAAEDAALWCLWGAANRLTLVSPVVCSMAMIARDLSGTLDVMDGDFWRSWGQPLLRTCGGVVVPPVPGWQASVGVWRAACHALRYNSPVFLLRADVSAVASAGPVAVL